MKLLDRRIAQPTRGEGRFLCYWMTSVLPGSLRTSRTRTATPPVRVRSTCSVAGQVARDSGDLVVGVDGYELGPPWRDDRAVHLVQGSVEPCAVDDAEPCDRGRDLLPEGVSAAGDQEPVDDVAALVDARVDDEPGRRSAGVLHDDRVVAGRRADPGDRLDTVGVDLV